MDSDLVSLVIVNIPNFAGFMLGLIVLWLVTKRLLAIIERQQEQIVALAKECAELRGENT